MDKMGNCFSENYTLFEETGVRVVLGRRKKGMK